MADCESTGDGSGKSLGRKSGDSLVTSNIVTRTERRAAWTTIMTTVMVAASMGCSTAPPPDNLYLIPGEQILHSMIREGIDIDPESDGWGIWPSPEGDAVVVYNWFSEQAYLIDEVNPQFVSLGQVDPLDSRIFRWPTGRAGSAAVVHDPDNDSTSVVNTADSRNIATLVPGIGFAHPFVREGRVYLIAENHIYTITADTGDIKSDPCPKGVPITMDPTGRYIKFFRDRFPFLDRYYFTYDIESGEKFNIGTHRGRCMLFLSGDWFLEVIHRADDGHG